MAEPSAGESATSKAIGIAFRETRSGRRVLPTLDFWRGQYVERARDGTILGASPGTPEPPTKHRTPRRKSSRRKSSVSTSEATTPKRPSQAKKKSSSAAEKTKTPTKTAAAATTTTKKTPSRKSTSKTTKKSETQAAVEAAAKRLSSTSKTASVAKRNSVSKAASVSAASKIVTPAKPVPVNSKSPAGGKAALSSAKNSKSRSSSTGSSRNSTSTTKKNVSTSSAASASVMSKKSPSVTLPIAEKTSSKSKDRGDNGKVKKKHHEHRKHHHHHHHHHHRTPGEEHEKEVRSTGSRERTSSTSGSKKDKPHRTSYDNDYDDVVEPSNTWSIRDEQLLNIAIAAVDPLSQRRWSKIAAMVPGKTAQQCRAKFENQPDAAAEVTAPRKSSTKPRDYEDENDVYDRPDKRPPKKSTTRVSSHSRTDYRDDDDDDAGDDDYRDEDYVETRPRQKSSARKRPYPPRDDGDFGNDGDFAVPPKQRRTMTPAAPNKMRLAESQWRQAPPPARTMSGDDEFFNADDDRFSETMMPLSARKLRGNRTPAMSTESMLATPRRNLGLPFRQSLGPDTRIMDDENSSFGMYQRAPATVARRPSGAPVTPAIARFSQRANRAQTMSALQRLQKQQQYNRDQMYAEMGSRGTGGAGVGAGASMYDAYDDPAVLQRTQRRSEFRDDDEMMFGPSVSRTSNPWIWD